MRPEQPVAIYPTEIFISHSNADAGLARRLREGLLAVNLQALREAAGLAPAPDDDRFGVWTFENDLPFGGPLNRTVKDRIRDCDVFMIILPRAEHSSPWLQRELGLALDLSHKVKMGHPLIVAMLAEPGVPMTMPVRDFDSGELTGNSFDFAAIRCFAPASPHTDAFSDLVRSLLLEVHCFGTDSADPALIPAGPNGAFACYEDLFPVRQERDRPRDIAHWLRRAFLQDTSATYCRLFLTLQLGDVCIGIAFLDLDRSSRWIFGAYFGIRAEWRGDQRARRFLLTIIEQCRKVVRDAKGIVFEVEPYDDALVRSVLRKFRREASRSSAGVRLTRAETATIRAVKRIALYTRQRSGALAVAFGDRSPVSYIQPAMSLPLGSAGEVALWLMVYPIEILAGSPGASDMASDISHPLDARDLLCFLYDVMFSEAYVRDPETALDGFEPYVREIERLVSRSIGDRAVFLVNRLILSQDARDLLTHWDHRIRELGIKL